MSIRKDMETPATSLHFIKTIANQLTGIQTVINRLAQASESLLERAVENGGIDPEIEARLTRHAELQSDLLAEYSSMFSQLSEGASRVLLEMMRLGTSDARQLFDENGNLRAIADLPDDVAAAIASVKVVKRPIFTGKRNGDSSGDNDIELEEQTHEIKLWDKNKALTNLGKHFGLLRDIVQHTGPDGGPIEIDVSARPIPVESLSASKQRKILAILEEDESGADGDGNSNGGGSGNGAVTIDAESRLLPESAEPSNVAPSQSLPYVVPFPFSD